MQRKNIPIEALTLKVHDFWSEHWILLTAGDYSARKFNTMAVGWGSLGVMWGKPFVQVVVRPVRHTHEFISGYETFTVCAFPDACRDAVQLLGSKSGRDGDKIAESGLTPMASAIVAAPGFAEAELIIECRKIYRSIIDPRGFLDQDIDRHYPLKDYHGVFFGEVLAVSGVESFISP